MKIAIFIDNENILGVDCRNPEHGNPGIGGTEYCILLLAQVYKKAYPSDEVVLFATKQGMLPKTDAVEIVSGPMEIGKIFKKTQADMLLISAVYHGEPLSQEFFKMIEANQIKTILWGHNFYLSDFCKKIWGFLQYTRFMKKEIKRKNYEKLVVLTSQTAIPLFFELSHQYRNRFIYDYRDITKEPRSKIYKKMVLKLFESAKYVMVSSKGFLDYLGVKDSDKIVLAHNTQKIESVKVDREKREVKSSIKLVYWGMVRQVEYNKKVCDLFGNDLRFELYYHGDGFYNELKKYCNEKGYKNILFTGKYYMSDIENFTVNTDIVNCLYDNDINTQPTLAVKLYDAIKYKLPMIVSKGSYLAEYSKNLSGVFSIDISESVNALDALYEWYKKLDMRNVNEDYRRIESEIYQDDLFFRQKLLSFVTQ